MSTLKDLLEKIRDKPGLYIGSASVTQLRMFIVGYRFARAEMGLTMPESDRDFYKTFQPWLQNRLSIRTVSAWDKVISLTCTNEQAAFDFFFQLLDEFWERDRSKDVDPALAASYVETEQVA